MDWSSWLRRSVSSSKNSRNPDQQIPKPEGGGGGTAWNHAAIDRSCKVIHC
ncbi:hypothetical protein OIU77_024311 [Salix suchowensis]|uniref:Uncharacterized protein n=1 Tax=Salix suchowensis TaxID=1278906 RepID=A0ABQ9BWD2_9ROSI|nr:hypothetical protein OIU77_024311 [Salix suchowensis]